MKLNELFGDIKDKFKQDLEFGKTYAANVVGSRQKISKNSSGNSQIDPVKLKLAIKNRLTGQELSDQDISMFKLLSANDDENLSAAATNTIRKLPLTSQDQRVLQAHQANL